MPSRPNMVLNHGMPAYGYGPFGVSVTIIAMSARERSSHSSNRSLEVRTCASRVRNAVNPSLRRPSAVSNASRRGGPRRGAVARDRQHEVARSPGSTSASTWHPSSATRAGPARLADRGPRVSPSRPWSASTTPSRGLRPAAAARGRPVRAAHFEEVAEVGVERAARAERPSASGRELVERDAVNHVPPPEEGRAPHVQDALGPELVVVARMSGLVRSTVSTWLPVPAPRRISGGGVAGHPQLAARKVARAVVIEPLLPARRS